MAAVTTPPGREVDGVWDRAPGGTYRDECDDRRFRHARERHEGFPIGQYMQPAPMLFTADRHPVWIGDLFRGRSLFLTLSGPSLQAVNLDPLRDPGMMTMGVNNSPAAFRPNLWCEVDNPQNFLMSTWLDSRIMKFCPLDHAAKKLFDSARWRESKTLVQDCPNVFFYQRNERFDPAQWLHEDTLNWGNHSDLCVKCNFQRPSKKDIERGAKKIKVCPNCGSKHFGSRTVMLPTIRIAFILGFRKVFLLGADFKMQHGKQNYAFEQDRSKQSVKNNNNTYEILNYRFEQLRPYFEKHGFHVLNCTQGSGLTAFDFIPYNKALQIAQAEMPDMDKETTAGMYDRSANEKQGKASKPLPKIDNIDDFEKHMRERGMIA